MKQYRWVSTTLLVIAVVLTLAGKARADGGLPVNFTGPRPLGQNEYGVFSRIVLMDSTIAQPPGARVTVRAVPVIVGVGLTPTETLLVAVPYVEKALRAVLPTGRELRLESRGLGDLQTTWLQQIWRHDRLGRTSQVAAVAGIQWPTGRTDVTDGTEGRLPVPLQPGSGAFRATVGLSYMAEGKRTAFYAQTTYSASLRGAQGFRAGNALDYDVAFGYRLRPRSRGEGRETYLLVEAVGRVDGPDHTNGTGVAGSGGHFLLLGPSLQQIVTKNLLIELSLLFPATRDGGASQPVPVGTATLGLRYLF